MLRLHGDVDTFPVGQNQLPAFAHDVDRVNSEGTPLFVDARDVEAIGRQRSLGVDFDGNLLRRVGQEIDDHELTVGLNYGPP